MSKKINQQVNDYLEYCENVRRMTEASLDSRSWTVSSFLKLHPDLERVEDITTQHLLDFMASFSKRGNTGKTINSRMSELLPMLRWFLEMGTPIPNLNLHLIQKAKERPPRRNHFTSEQIDKALKCANPCQWLLIKLAYDCGLRLSELINLRLINIDGRMVRVVGKGQKLGEMWMTKEARERLDLWINSRGITDYIFPSPIKEDSPIKRTTAYRWMKKPFELAGIDGFYPHALRHSFATDKQKKGATPFELQLMLRHSSVNTSMRYLHGFEGRSQEVFEKYAEGATLPVEGKADLRQQLVEVANKLAKSGEPEKMEKAATIYNLLAKL